MVDFHDRRRVALNAPTEAPDLHSGSGVFLSRKVINDCFVVTSAATEAGREWSVNEVLPDGRTVLRQEGYPTPYAAKKDARAMQPSSVRPLR